MPGLLKLGDSYTRTVILFGMGIIVLVSSLVSCPNETVNERGGNGMSATTIKEVLRKYTDDLMSIQGVVGIGEGLCKDKPCIKIFVIRKTSELEEKIPKELEGHPVKVEETGEIRPLPENPK